MRITQLLASRNYLIINKDLLKIFGLEATILLGELCSEYEYWENQNLAKDGFFFSTIENIKDNTTLSVKQQKNALTKLMDLNVIECKVMGLPARRYFKINETGIVEFVQKEQTRYSQKGQTSLSKRDKLDIAERDKLDCPKGTTNNNNINNNNLTIINNNNKIKDIIVEIINYLNEKTHSNYKSSTSKTQTLINARLKEGFSIDDFKTVIDKKSLDWLNDSKMSQYLRPETLFGTKFESYLNQKEKQITTKDLVNQGIITLDNFDDDVPF